MYLIATANVSATEQMAKLQTSSSSSAAYHHHHHHHSHQLRLLTESAAFHVIYLTAPTPHFLPHMQVGEVRSLSLDRT